jgi:hypothetical protein
MTEEELKAMYQKDIDELEKVKKIPYKDLINADFNIIQHIHKLEENAYYSQKSMK